MENLSGRTFSIFRPPLKNAFAVLSISIVYLCLARILVGFKTEQLWLVLFFNSFYFLSLPTRRFILGFSIFIVYWIIFDFMKAFPNYHYQSVHIADIYNTEKKIFGIQEGGMLLTPNEYWSRHETPFLDKLTGFLYLTWIPLPLLFALFLFYWKRSEYYRFAFSFLTVNLIGFVVYYFFPAAPPWYVSEYGFTFHAHTMGSTAGLERFDQLFHTEIFKSIYAQSSNVFAAMPSLHSAYPLVVLYFAVRNHLVGLSYFSALIMEGIWFSAIYNSHHYVLDVLAGIACGIAGLIIFAQIQKQIPFFLSLDQNTNPV